MAKSKPEPPIATELRRVDPRKLRPRDKNARFMTAQQMKRLTDNVRADGTLTSLPLVYQHEDGSLEIVSGHHRTQAAIGAELAEIDAIVITTPLSPARITSIQLSHNAISGQDDTSILGQLYDGLDLFDRKYSGLTDDVLTGIDKISMAGLAVGASIYEELRINFLPDDREQFVALVKRLGKTTDDSLAAAYRDFDGFFDTLIRVKDALKVHNSGIALRLMAELAVERLDQLEADNVGDEATGAERPPAGGKRRRPQTPARPVEGKRGRARAAA